MRWLLIAIAFASLGIASASAKPKVAVTVDGDADDKMGETVREVLEGKLAVVTPKDVERAMSKLGLSAPLAEDDVQKLRERLDAAVVVQGKLGKAGAKKTVRLTVWVRGKKPSDFNVQYKTAGSEKFRDTVRDALLKRIGSIDELESGEEKPKKKRLNEGDEVKDKDEDKDKDKPKKKRLSEGDEDKDKDKDKPKKKAEGDEDKDKDKPKKKRLAEGDEDKDKPKKKTDPDEDKPKKRVAEGDGNGEGEGEGEGDKDKDKDKPKKKKKVATAEDGDGNTRVRKRRRSSDGDGEGVSEPEAAPLPAARVDAGVGYGARYLTFAIDATSTNRPPKVLTPAISGRIEGEIYPLAFSNRRGAGAGLALFGEYAKTLGLSITIPNGMGKAASINQAHYMLGAGYRLALGKAAVSVGVAYAGRHYIADRAGLTAPTQLDTPDVDYSGVAPVLGGRGQVTPKISVFAGLDALLVMSAGAITKAENYGKGNVFGIGGNAGVDVALGKQIGLRFAAEYNQVSLSFKGTGTMAAARKVSAATDRDFGAMATFAAMY